MHFFLNLMLLGMRISIDLLTFGVNNFVSNKCKVTYDMKISRNIVYFIPWILYGLQLLYVAYIDLQDKEIFKNEKLSIDYTRNPSPMSCLPFIGVFVLYDVLEEDITLIINYGSWEYRVETRAEYMYNLDWETISIDDGSNELIIYANNMLDDKTEILRMPKQPNPFFKDY